MEPVKQHPELTGRQFYPDCSCDHCEKLYFDTWQWKLINKILDTKVRIKRLWIFLMPNRYQIPHSLFCMDCRFDVSFGDYNQCAAPKNIRIRCNQLKIAYAGVITLALRLENTREPPLDILRIFPRIPPKNEDERQLILAKIRNKIEFLEEHWQGKPLL